MHIAWTLLAVGAALVASIAAVTVSPTVRGATPPSTQTTMNTIYIGTYTRPGGSDGIYRATFDPSTGAIGKPTFAAKSESPSYLAISADGRFAYAVAEVDTFNGAKSGAVVAFAIQPDGSLTELNRQASGGAGPCYVSVSPDGKAAFVANYGGGSVAMLPIAVDGSLKPASTVDEHQGKSVDPKRQDKPYGHSIRPDPSGRFAIACDLGTDEVIVYRIDGDAMTRTSVAKVAPSSGPRHSAFSSDGKTLYVVDELSSTVTRLDWDALAGTLAPKQTITTLPAGFGGVNTCAEIAVHPGGRFVFASNRGDDSIAVFAVDPSTGELSAARQFKTNGSTPRNFVIDPSGRFLIASNQKSDSIVTFAIDPMSGALTPVGSPVTLGMPCCIRFAK